MLNEISCLQIDIGLTICENRLAMRFHIGNMIAKIRHERGMTQAVLAAKADVRPSTLSDLENLKGDPKLSTIQKVADAWDAPVSSIKERQPYRQSRPS